MIHLVVEQSLDMQKYRQKGGAKQTKSGLFEANCRSPFDDFCSYNYSTSQTTFKREKSCRFGSSRGLEKSTENGLQMARHLHGPVTSVYFGTSQMLRYCTLLPCACRWIPRGPGPSF